VVTVTGKLQTSVTAKMLTVSGERDDLYLWTIYADMSFTS